MGLISWLVSLLRPRRTNPVPTSPVQKHIEKHASKYVWVTVAVTMVGAFEGLITHPYRDSVGVLTVCYGATAADHVQMKNYTPAECKDMLARDLLKYDAPLKKCLKPEVYDALPLHRHVALVSLAYNVGDGAVCRSSVVRDLNAGRVRAACDDFMHFTRAGGRVLQGLVTRRRTEREACLRND